MLYINHQKVHKRPSRGESISYDARFHDNRRPFGLRLTNGSRSTVLFPQKNQRVTDHEDVLEREDSESRDVMVCGCVLGDSLLTSEIGADALVAMRARQRS